MAFPITFIIFLAVIAILTLVAIVGLLSLMHNSNSLMLASEGQSISSSSLQELVSPPTYLTTVPVRQASSSIPDDDAPPPYQTIIGTTIRHHHEFEAPPPYEIGTPVTPAISLDQESVTPPPYDTITTSCIPVEVPDGCLESETDSSITTAPSQVQESAAPSSNDIETLDTVACSSPEESVQLLPYETVTTVITESSVPMEFAAPTTQPDSVLESTMSLSFEARTGENSARSMVQELVEPLENKAASPVSTASCYKQDFTPSSPDTKGIEKTVLGDNINLSNIEIHLPMPLQDSASSLCSQLPSLSTAAEDCLSSHPAKDTLPPTYEELHLHELPPPYSK